VIDISSYYFINSPLEDLAEPQAALLLASGTEKKYNRGESIFKVNEFPKGIFIIRKGRVKIYQRVSSGADQIMNIHVAGEIIGYRPLLCNERYPVTASAVEACTLLFVPAKTFSSLLSQSSEFSNLLLRYLSHEFTVWVNTISLLAHKTVKERLLVNLLILLAKYQEPSRWPIKISLPKTDIANLIGTSNETLARVLQSLKKDNLIAPKGRAIQVNNLQQLRKIQAEVKLFL
jgi:CRP-like cAMP-binding protein